MHMTDLMPWNTSFSVNIKTLDAQHTRLVGMLNALSDAVRRNEADAMLALLLDGLLRYTEAHFAEEEALMAKHNFPGLIAHRADHEALTSRVQEFRREFAAGNREIATDLLQFMREWLTEHILKTDQGYSAYLRSHGEV
jgi:hemerythrin-like metal-binding protein